LLFLLAFAWKDTTRLNAAQRLLVLHPSSAFPSCIISSISGPRPKAIMLCVWPYFFPDTDPAKRVLSGEISSCMAMMVRRRHAGRSSRLHNLSLQIILEAHRRMLHNPFKSYHRVMFFFFWQSSG